MPAILAKTLGVPVVLNRLHTLREVLIYLNYSIQLVTDGKIIFILIFFPINSSIEMSRCETFLSFS